MSLDSNDTAIWGFHMGTHHGSAPIDTGYITIGWPELGDPSKLAADREAFKARYAEVMPQAKAGAVRVAAGQIYRFYHEMRIGDLVAFPSKFDRQINIGEIIGEPKYDALSSPDYPNRRAVKWLGHFDRSKFSQNALYEMGSALTLFRISSYADEIIAALANDAGNDVPAEGDDEADATAAIVEQFQETTDDFIVKKLKNDQSPYEFEHFVAHLLTCMGYHARVTKASGDGGIDVIAHRDELGFEPPIIKVQCKQSTGSFGRPDVQKLYGSIERDEMALFISLGSYSADARTFENSKSNLRLLGGIEIVDLVKRHYGSFSPRYRALIPLKQTFSPA